VSININNSSRAYRPDSLRDWEFAMGEDHKISGISDSLCSPMYLRFARLKALQLLFTPIVSIEASSLLQTPEHYLRMVPGEYLFPFIEPIREVKDVKQFRAKKIERETLISVVRETIGKSDPSLWMVTLQRSYTLLFNGNIIVRRDGSVIGEFTAGTGSPSQQKSQIDCRVSRDLFLGTFKYTNSDEVTRRSIAKAIAALPGVGSGRQKEYQRGYYEVGLGVDEDSGRVLPLFYDYRDEPFFVGD
jgi:hypothetical protein